MKDVSLLRKRGFTIAELLIVVAIVGVLVAVSIPVIEKKLEKSKETVDIHTMRAAAALGQQFYYAGVVDRASALAAHMQWYQAGGNDKNEGSNAFAIYIAEKGAFSENNYDNSIDAGLKAYGKGTKKDGGMEYKLDGKMVYDPKVDYTKGVCQVSIFPNGNKKRIEVAWKELKKGTTRPFIGGSNYPKLTIYLN